MAPGHRLEGSGLLLFNSAEALVQALSRDPSIYPLSDMRQSTSKIVGYSDEDAGDIKAMNGKIKWTAAQQWFLVSMILIISVFFLPGPMWEVSYCAAIVAYILGCRNTQEEQRRKNEKDGKKRLV